MIPTHRPSLSAEELNAISEVFETRWLGKGSVTETFEEKLAQLLGAKHVFCLNSCTAALQVALESLKLEPGFEVLAPSMTFPASIQAILLCGGRPVFCEVAPETLNISVDDLVARITPNCRVIMPVHYAGRPCEMQRILEFAQAKNLFVVEDAAHAFGSSYQGRNIGVIGDITCFSFDPIKNITCGSGGALVTNNDEIAKRIPPIRNIGIDADSWSRIGNHRPWKYRVITPGYRYLMSNLNAAIGLEQLKKLNLFKTRKQAIVQQYNQAFAEEPCIIPINTDSAETFPFSYVIRVPSEHRAALISQLRANGVDSAVQFTPNHLQPAFTEFRTELPTTESLFDEILTIPLFYEMSDADVSLVIDSVLDFFHSVDT